MSTVRSWQVCERLGAVSTQANKRAKRQASEDDLLKQNSPMQEAFWLMDLILFIKVSAVSLNQSSMSIKAEEYPGRHPNWHLPFQACNLHPSLQHSLQLFHSAHFTPTGDSKEACRTASSGCASHSKENFNTSNSSWLQSTEVCAVGLVVPFCLYDDQIRTTKQMWYEISPTVLQARAQMYK